MEYFGLRMKVLNIYGCCYIFQQVFEEVFFEDVIYFELVDLEISFCENVNDFVLGFIF